VGVHLRQVKRTWAKDAWLKLRIKQRDIDILRAYAEHVGKSMSQVVRDFISSLERKLPKGWDSE
jgi:hypothetical protein